MHWELPLDVWLTAPLDLLLFVVRGHNKLRSDTVRYFICTVGNPDRSLEYLPVLPTGNTENQHNNRKDLLCTYYVQGANVEGLQPVEI